LLSALDMEIKCPRKTCLSDSETHFRSRRIVQKGVFRRKSDRAIIRRYFCRNCNRSFSGATRSRLFAQKRRRINGDLKKLLVSGVSLRRAARLLRANRKTIVRRFHWLADQAKREHESWVKKYTSKNRIQSVQFDDLETSEHTKCKPISVTLAVEPKKRKILHIEVSRMPAKGPLAHLARKKYGYRRDERPEGWKQFFSNLEKLLPQSCEFLSDENPHYPRHLRRSFPNSIHNTVKGARGSIAGQGELKKLVHDPLFSLNHTCAMLRANINRLFRRTWCLSKNVDALSKHLYLYIQYHNQVLT
jgi:transposase-like protein